MKVTKSVPSSKQERQLISAYKRLSKAHKRLGKRADREGDLVVNAEALMKAEASDPSDPS